MLLNFLISRNLWSQSTILLDIRSVLKALKPFYEVVFQIRKEKVFGS